MHFAKLLCRLQAMLPRSDLPGAKQPTPFNVNRYALLLLYGLYGCFTAAVFFNWPAMAGLIMQNEGFANLCPQDAVTGEFLNDLRKTAKKDYICDDQDAAVQKLFPMTGALCCLMSACGGALLDWIGPRWTTCLGQSSTLVGWLLLAFSGHDGIHYIAGMAFIGLGADSGFLPALCVTRLFPGASGFVITFLGSASTASAAVPLVMLSLMENGTATLKQAALGYIAVGPCFAIFVALLLLPAKNFLVERDTRSEQEENAAKEKIDMGVAPDATEVKVLEDVVAEHSDKRLSSRGRSPWGSFKKLRFFEKSDSRPLPVVRTSHTRPVRGSEAGGTSVDEDEDEDEVEREESQTQIMQLEGASLYGTQGTVSTAAEGGDAAMERGPRTEASVATLPQVLYTAAEGGHRCAKEDEEMRKGFPEREEERISWVAVDLNEVASAGSVFTVVGALEEGDPPAASPFAASGERGGARGTKRSPDIEQADFKRRGDARGRRDDGVVKQMEVEAETFTKTRFLRQAFSVRFLLVVLYFVGVSWAGAFFQQAPRRMFSSRVVWTMEVLQPFGSLPCVILGRLADIFGILSIITLINTFGLLMYSLSLGDADVFGYMSVVCFTLYISLFTSQVFIYIEKTFSPTYFGKLIGLTVLTGGLSSFVCNPLYESIVIRLNKGNPLPVQIAMIVLLCMQYIWIGSLFHLQRKNPYPYRNRLSHLPAVASPTHTSKADGGNGLKL